MKKDILLSKLKANLTDELYDTVIKLAYIKFNKENIRTKFYQSIIDGNIDIKKEWEPFSSIYLKYEKSVIDKLKKGDTDDLDLNNVLIQKIVSKNPLKN